MNEIIRINTNENAEPVVSGRELHKGLEVKTKYIDWINRMLQYGFVKNTDYILVSQKRETKNPRNPYTEETDHILKLDMAKEISMLQRNEKGKQIRQYFIEVEKEYNSPEKIMARALIISNRQIESLKLESKIKDQKIAELEPKADYTDRILNSKSLVTISQIAKDYGMSGTALNDKLHDLKVQYKQSGQWLLYAKYQAKGYTHSETTDLRQINGTDKVIMRTKWTQKGRLFLYDILKKNGVLPVIERN